MRKKISVIGGGNVGATTALFLAEKHLGDIVLTDIVEGMPQGKGLDMLETGPIHGYHSHVMGTNDYTDIAGSDVVVVTAGLPRKPGMSRSDLLGMNAKIVGSVCSSIKEHAPGAIVIIVSNPLDIMCSVALQKTGFASNKVIGMAGVLDTTRMRTFIAEALDVHAADVVAMVLGGHGDSMVPLKTGTSVSGIPITQLLPDDQIEAIFERTRKGGGEIVQLLKTGSAFGNVQDMEEQLGAVGVSNEPAAEFAAHQNQSRFAEQCELGSNGIEKIYEMELTADELKALQASASAVKEDLKTLASMEY